MLYTKDYLLESKITYYQLEKGYRSGIEPIILAAQANENHKNILDLGCGNGTISLIIAHRFPGTNIHGFEKNTIHLKISKLNKTTNGFKNIKFTNQDVTKFNKKYLRTFDLILSNPPFFFTHSVIMSKNKSLKDAKYITKNNLYLWIENALKYLKINGECYLINRFENLNYMLEILKNLNAEVRIKPILSFRNSKPKNVLIMFKNSTFYKEKKLKNLIIHTKTSRYSKKIQNWFK